MTTNRRGFPVVDAGTAPLLSVRDLSVSFGRGAGEVRAVREASFDVGRGETVALVGESGSGKSVTALSILRLLPEPPSWRRGGSIRFLGEELTTVTPARMRALRGDRMAMIFQEPQTSLNPLHPIGRQIAEAVMVHRPTRAAAAYEHARSLLEQVGMADAVDRMNALPHEFSGGQQQRVMIAIALANEPDLLIADEPTTALDVTIEAQILDLLKDLQARMRMALLLITHDLDVVRRMASRVCVMQAGEIVEQGAVAEVFTQPRHPYTQRLLASRPKGRPAVPPGDGAELIAARDLKVWFPIKRGVLRRTCGWVKAVDQVSLAIGRGRTLGVVGESGSGKSTLGRALLRLGPSEGSIVFDGRELQGLGFRALRPLRRRLQIVFQDPYASLSPRMSVGDIVGEGLRINRIAAGEELRARVAAALADVGLDPGAQDRYPHEFSGGQRQRVAIARALALAPELIVLDEPTSALDVSVQAQIVDLLRELQQRRGLAYLFISHDLKVVRALAHDIVVLRQGRVVERGSTDEVFERPREPYTRELVAAAFRMDGRPAIVEG